jgi:nitrogen fixation protein NifQ
MPEEMLHARSNGGLNALPLPSAPSIGVWQLIGHSNGNEVLRDAFAWVIATHCNPQSDLFIPALGLDYATFTEILNRYFPHFIPPQYWLEAQIRLVGKDGMLEEFPDLLQLLYDHCSVKDTHHRCVSHLVVAACMGGDHLWQDMGLPNRQAMSELLGMHFPSLAAKNTGDMKWKKFFYKQLCERADINACKAPSCTVCCDYSRCFGPED